MGEVDQAPPPVVDAAFDELRTLDSRVAHGFRPVSVSVATGPLSIGRPMRRRIAACQLPNAIEGCNALRRRALHDPAATLALLHLNPGAQPLGEHGHVAN